MSILLDIQLGNKWYTYICTKVFDVFAGFNYCGLLLNTKLSVPRGEMLWLRCFSCLYLYVQIQPTCMVIEKAFCIPQKNAMHTLANVSV